MIVDLTDPIALVTEKTKKRPHQDEPSSEGVVAKFPTDISVYSDPEASQVIDWGLTGSFQALQSLLFLRKDVKSLSKKVSTLTSPDTKLKKKLSQAEGEIARTRATLGSSEKNLSQTDEMFTDAIEKVNNAADKTIIQTRGQAIWEQQVVAFVESVRLRLAVKGITPQLAALEARCDTSSPGTRVLTFDRLGPPRLGPMPSVLDRLEPAAPTLDRLMSY
ncbi:hypothetical protein Ddye_011099 [Dipteronia dyeriana]|uniref:Uncharacterized protein n=1 Tax=Dipteronia dyeriana TaxID=168575 RepID=A0AAE0CNW0_9ROSI|nr:hypothetical protein Ddye_011099 [Dipteronia dyeriana]